MLSGLVKKIDQNVRVLNVEDPASLEATAAACRRSRRHDRQRQGRAGHGLLARNRRAIAEALASAGAAVVLGARDETRLAEAVERSSAGGRPPPFPRRVPARVGRRRPAAVLERHGRIDGLVNNAASPGNCSCA